MKILECIKVNRKTILKRCLIVAASVGGLLLASKLLTGDEETEDGVVDVDYEPVEESEESTEE